MINKIGYVIGIVLAVILLLLIGFGIDVILKKVMYYSQYRQLIIEVSYYYFIGSFLFVQLHKIIYGKEDNTL